MDGMNSACFRKCNKQHSKRHSSLCYSSSTVNPVILSEKQIYLCSSDCCAARVGKKYSCKQAQQRRVKNGRNYLSRVTSSHGNRRETFLNETLIFFTMNGQWHALDVVPTIHHQLPVESPVSCISWSPLLATTCRRWGTFAYIGQMWFTVSAQQSALALNVCGSGQMTNTCCFL